MAQSRVEWVELGRLGRPKGLKGWLHLESWTEPPEGLFDYPTWHLRNAAGQRRSCEVAEARPTPSGFEARIDLTISDEGPMAVAFVIISAVPPGSPG